MRTILIIIATAYAVYSILLKYGVFEFSSGKKKVIDDISTARKNSKKRRFEHNKLKLYSTMTEFFSGILMNDFIYEKHRYYIERLDIRSEVLNRRYTPEELRGRCFLPFFMSLFVIPLSVFIPFLVFLPIGTLAYFLSYQTFYNVKISEEDSLIDDYFIDLYLLLYSKLRQGSRARLQGTVENYIDILESQYQTDAKEAMLNLSRYLLNLLALYEDHVAVPKLREIYHSATIINFCNVATQALNGIDNYENLLTFKMQLVERKTNLMRIRSAKLVQKGERSIYAIWIILFIFVIVGWYSKLPTGFF